MDLLVFQGGTFDPVHEGHLGIARAARDALDAEIRLMPAADPPHRPAPGAAAVHRARMLDLAVAGERRLKVDRRELRRTGRSYSVETLREIRGETGEAQPLALLLGADSFLGLPQWHCWQALFELAHFVVADRPGASLEQDLPEPLAAAIHGRRCDSAAVLHAAPAGRLLRLHQPLQVQAATAVRRGIASGDAGWRDLVPAAVAGYIDRHGLYRTPEDDSVAELPDNPGLPPASL